MFGLDDVFNITGTWSKSFTCNCSNAIDLRFFFLRSGTPPVSTSLKEVLYKPLTTSTVVVQRL